MGYPRPRYLDPAFPTERTKLPFVNEQISIPMFSTPISPIDNFRRMARRDGPLWVPNTMSDIQTIMSSALNTEKVRGMQIGPYFKRAATEDYVFHDWFNCSWTWVCSAGGAMLTPGTHLIDDITDWESGVEFPTLSEWDIKETAQEYLNKEHDPRKALSIVLGQGCTERLISVLGGYTEGMLALAVEPEAVKAFLGRFSEHIIELFDLINSLYPIDMISYHDDWGTERDTFFSERMMEDIVFAPTKRIVDHIKSKGVVFELHSCGNIERFLPYMVDLGIDFLQIQRRAVDIPKMKRMYGDKIGFNTGIEGLPFGESVPLDELIALIRESVALYGKGGGFYTFLFERDPEHIWAGLSELYAFSREFYEAGN